MTLVRASRCDLSPEGGALHGLSADQCTGDTIRLPSSERMGIEWFRARAPVATGIERRQPGRRQRETGEDRDQIERRRQCSPGVDGNRTMPAPSAASRAASVKVVTTMELRSVPVASLPLAAANNSVCGAPWTDTASCSASSRGCEGGGRRSR